MLDLAFDFMYQFEVDQVRKVQNSISANETVDETNTTDTNTTSEETNDTAENETSSEENTDTSENLVSE